MKLHSLMPFIGTKKSFILLFYFLIVSAVTTVNGATKTWIGTNSTWGTSSNWSPSGVPATADDVVIAFTSGGNYPIISSTITVESLTVNATAFLTVNTGANLSIASFLNVNGTLTINDGIIDQGTDHGGGDDFYGTGTVNMYNGTFKVGHDFRAYGTFNGTGGLVNFTGNGGGNAWKGTGTTQFYNVLINASLNPKFGTSQYVTFSVSGNWTNNSSSVDLISKGSKVIFNGTGAQTIGGSQTTTFSDVETSGSASTKSLAINTVIAGNLSILSGTLDLLTLTINRGSSGGTISIATGATLKIGGTNTFPSNYTTKSFGSPGIVEYSGTGTNQTIANLDYADLTLSGSGTKTFPALAVNNGTVASNPILGIGTLRILNNTLKVILPNNSTNDEGIFSSIYRNNRRYKVNELIFGTGS
jgi:hypothetical protein